MGRVAPRGKSSPRTWSRAVEAASIGASDPHLAAAAKNFDERLGPEQQMRLAREVATTRSAELTLAYKNVIMAAVGHKKRSNRLGRQRLVRVPCIVLVVRKKWSKDYDAKAGAQLIPKRLLAYADVDGERLLCAVPTDVQPEAHFSGVTPHSARAVFVDDGAVNPEFGTVTCAVEVTIGSKKKRHVLSARHVFSPMPEIAGPITASVPFAPLLSVASPPGAPVIGRSEPIGGALRDRPDPSFDVQLAQIDNASWAVVRSMLAEMPLSVAEPFVATVERFDEIVASHRFEILVPDNQPKAGMKPRATYSAAWETTLGNAFAFDYPVRVHGIRQFCSVSHWELLKLSVANHRVPLAGDSGSPVVMWNDDDSCTLVGMHIAGAGGEPVSYAIPSWQLFNIDNYEALPSSARIRPISP